MSFDLEVIIASTEVSNPGQAAARLRALRRRAQRAGARVSAAKCLDGLYWGSKQGRVRIARRMVMESPDPRSWRYLAMAYVAAGANQSAKDAFRKMLSQDGDLPIGHIRSIPHE